MTCYQNIAIQTYRNSGEASSKSIRARPLPAQGIATTMKVECSAEMRTAHPIGTVFIVKAKIISRGGGSPFVYTSWQWPYTITTLKEAQSQIDSGKLCAMAM